MGNLCAFKLFGLGYFIYLVLGIGLAVGLILGLKKLNDRGRLIANIVMISSVYFLIILEFIGRIIIIDEYNFFENMPIDYFQIFATMMLIGIITKKTKWTKFAYFIVVPVCFFSLIFIPKFYTNYSSFSLPLISFVLSQGLLIALSILNIFWSENDLYKKDILDTMVTFVIISASLHIINVILRFTFLGVHANYGATMGETYDLCNELLFHFIPVPFVHLLPIFAIIVGLCFVTIIPFELLKTKKEKQEEIEELIALGNLKKQQEYRQKNAKKLTSQIYLKGDNKAKPIENKDVANKTKSDFVAQHKEIKVNNDTVDK